VSRRVAPLLSVLVLAACNGGPVDRHDLQHDGETLDSIACEGALVANGVARGRTTVFFAREQAEELWIQAANFADAFTHRRVTPGNERATRAAAAKATRLVHLLLRLHAHPSDRALGRGVEQALTRVGSCA
jgi:hypothetical protein